MGKSTAGRDKAGARTRTRVCVRCGQPTALESAFVLGALGPNGERQYLCEVCTNDPSADVAETGGAGAAPLAGCAAICALLGLLTLPLRARWDALPPDSHYSGPRWWEMGPLLFVMAGTFAVLWGTLQLAAGRRHAARVRAARGAGGHGTWLCPCGWQVRPRLHRCPNCHAWRCRCSAVNSDVSETCQECGRSDAADQRP